MEKDEYIYVLSLHLTRNFMILVMLQTSGYARRAPNFDMVVITSVLEAFAEIAENKEEGEIIA